LTEPDRFHEKARKNCLLKNFKKNIGKLRKDIMSQIFETDFEKKSSQKTNNFLGKNNKQQQQQILCKAILLFLTASP